MLKSKSGKLRNSENKEVGLSDRNDSLKEEEYDGNPYENKNVYDITDKTVWIWYTRSGVTPKTM